MLDLSTWIALGLLPERKLRIGSFFSGYGGLDLAAEAALDAKTEWVVEFDPAPSAVLAHRFPGIPNYGDITKMDWSRVPTVDIITGGSPCQDLSTAGRRAGMSEGTRSNLWVHMREAVAALQPKFVVWENVRGALSAKADSDLGWTEGLLDGRSESEKPAQEKDHALRALGRVLGDLCDLGYDAAWTTFKAGSKRSSDWNHVGAPHQRERVFVLAWPTPPADPNSRGDHRAGTLGPQAGDG